ncbi:MAG: PAS-domain containing protein [Thalassobaculaceae bacterium]|nr:PAS-domain containing protein [Thalassobaculaceae bacterium]
MAVVEDIEAVSGGGSPGPDPERAMDTRVLGEQLQFFFGQTRDAVVGHTAVSIAVFLLLLNQPVNRTALIWWLFGALIVAGLRLVIYRAFPRGDLAAHDVRRWRRRFEAISFASGGSFGLLPVLFLEPTNFEITAWILLIMAGLSGGALGTLSAYSNAFKYYMLAAMVPLVVRLLQCWHLDDSMDLMIIAVLFSMMAVYFLRFSRRFERALVGQIKSRLENIDLADRMSHQGEVLRSVMQAIPDAIAVVEDGGRFVYQNDRFQQMFEVPDHLLNGTLTNRAFNAFRRERGDFDHLEPAEMRKQLQNWERLEAAGEDFGYERVLKDGRILRVDNRPMPDGGWVRSWIDVSDERAAAAETARWSRLLQLTLDHVDQGLTFVDADGNHVLANRRFCELVGLPEDYIRRVIPQSEVIAALRERGELATLPPELNERLDRWDAGEDPSPRISYERRQANGGWLLVVANRLPEGGHVRTFTDITSRKEAEISAAERRELLESTLASIDQGVIMRDANDNILVFNNRLSELLGVPRAMYATNASSAELYAFHDQQKGIELPPELLHRIEEWTERRRQGIPVGRLEYDRPGPNGTWIHAVFQPLADGREIRTFSDMTEARRFQQALIEKTEFLETVLGSMEQGVLVTDTEGHITLWNDRARDMLELSSSTLEALPTTDELRAARQRIGEFDMSDPNVVAYVAHWNDWVDSEANDIFIHEREFKRGHWMLVYGRKLEGGGTVRTLTDITERKRDEAEAVAAREEAEETRERIRAILQSIPVGVLVYDPTMHVEFWNDAYCNFTGFSNRALEHHPHFIEYSQYIFEGHNRGKDMSLQKFMEYRRRVYESDGRYTSEFFFDKTGLDVQYIVASLPDGGRVNVIVDISQQKQAERTALDARDAAEEATRAKSAFLAAMSHEIRTPMNGVIGMAEVLEQTGLDEDQRGITGTIRESGQVLLRIIDDILDFSKIEAGRMELEAEPVDLRAISEAVLDTLAPAADSKDLDLVLEMDPSAPAVFVGDPVRLHQILMNLVGNAVKFTDSGAVAIRASARPDADFPSGVRLRFEVSDTGVGIEADRIDLLFQPFSQAEASTTRRFGGTGLGLSICRRLVGMMHGEIGVDSAPGAGSTFWFEVPVEPSILVGASDLDTIDLTGLSALVVARPGPMGDQVAVTLSWRGMAVIRAVDGNAAPTPGMSGAVIVDGRLGSDLLRTLVPSGDWGGDRTGAEARSLWVANPSAPELAPIAVSRPVRHDPLVRAVAAILGRASPEVPFVADPKVSGGGDLGMPTVDEAVLHGRLILVVEDNATNRMVVERQLAILGLAAETAVDGVEGLRMWREKPYGLVLTDCHMPNMDGYQLTAAIREEEMRTGGRVPIVALTANALVGEAERCLEAGMDDYLAKPVTLDVMGETLNRWLDASDRDTATPGSAPDGRSGGPGDTGPDEDGPIDFDQLRQILGSADPEFASAMLALFADSFRKLNGRMREAVEAGEMTELRESAHAAKGASANACATRLRTALEALERAAAAQETGAIVALFEEVEIRSAEVFDYLERMSAS